VGTCDHGMARPQVADGGTAFICGGQAANTLNKQSLTKFKVSTSVWGGGGAKSKQILTLKNYYLTKHLTRPRTCSYSFVQPKQRRGDR
jgi:hypothetical protein